MNKQKNTLILGALALIAVAAIAWYFLQPPAPGTGTAVASGSGYVLTDHDLGMGNPKAPVVLIEYAAPSCPVCAQFNEVVVPELKANYIDTGKVYYVFRIFPLRPDDGAAEKISRCLPEDKYFAFIDLLFRNQSKWDVEYGVQDVHGGLVRLARIAGMSAEQADQCMNDTALDKTINDVAEDGQSKYAITGTPTIVVDGQAQKSGFISYATLKTTIDTALAKK